MSNSQDRTPEKDLPTLSNTIKQIITCFKNPAEKNSASNLQSLAQSPDILARLVRYARDPTNEHRITVRSFSRVKQDDIQNMGVTIHRDVPFQSLVHTIQESPENRILLDTLSPIHSMAFSKSAGDSAFDSRAESRARVGIYQIMSAIINALRGQKVFLVEDHVIVARLRSKVPPVELQYKSDGTVHSYFLTGVLDFLCCSSNVDALFTPEATLKGFTRWESSPALPPNTTWKNIETFLRYVADKAKAFDDLSQDLETRSQWQLLVIEAKSRDAQLISQPDIPHSQVQNLAPDPEPRLQELFILDPDQWLLAHEKLDSLLPSDDNDSCVTLDHIVLDRYLSIIWHSLKNNRCRARYIPFDFLHDRGSLPDKSQIDRFRQIAGLPPSPVPCPLEPVVGVIHHNGRYLVVVVPHVAGSKEWVYIIGEESEFNQYGEIPSLGEGEWRGLLNIGHYHGWSMERYHVSHISWSQNPGNSGPIACEVVRSILKNGFSLKGDIPTYWCTHNSRLNVLNVVHTSAMQHLGRFPAIREKKGAMPEYIRYFSSRLARIEDRLEEFWKGAGDFDSQSGFVSISKKLAESMAKCRPCNIKFARDDLGADDDNNVDDDDDDDDLEMQEVAAHLLNRSTPDSFVHTLADRVDELDISDLPAKLPTCDPQPSNERSSSVAAKNAPVSPQRPRKQRSLKEYVYQAIAECLALHLAPKPERFQENILKFCVSSSEDWIFGVIDCTDDNHRPCYITDTLTYKFGYEDDAIKFNDIITLLVIWMCVPAEKILPYMKKCHDAFYT